MKQILLLILIIFLAGKTFSQQELKIEENRSLRSINNKFGVTDSSNNIIVPFVYDFIEYKNKRLIVHRHQSQGLLTTDNEVVVPIQYQFVLPRRNDRFILWTHNSLFGLCDADGKIILPVKYQSVSSTEQDDFYITRNGKKLNGVYDFNGKNILPEVYTFYTIDHYKVFAVKGNEPQILDLQRPDEKIHLDKDITFIETLRHYTMGEQFFQIVKKQNKYGVMNASNQVVVPIIYDEVKSSQHWRYFLIKKNNKIGIINVNGQIVKEPIYDGIKLLKEFVLLKRKNQKDESYSYEW